MIELERRSEGAPLGVAVHYTVRLDGTGVIRREGEGHMSDLGVESDRVDSSMALGLVNEFLGSLFFQAKEEYASQLRLVPTSDTGNIELESLTASHGLFHDIRVKIGSYEKRVSGRTPQLPEEIVRLADRVDEVTGTRQWLTTR